MNLGPYSCEVGENKRECGPPTAVETMGWFIHGGPDLKDRLNATVVFSKQGFSRGILDSVAANRPGQCEGESHQQDHHGQHGHQAMRSTLFGHVCPERQWAGVRLKLQVENASSNLPSNMCCQLV